MKGNLSNIARTIGYGKCLHCLCCCVNEKAFHPAVCPSIENRRVCLCCLIMDYRQQQLQPDPFSHLPPSSSTKFVSIEQAILVQQHSRKHCSNNFCICTRSFCAIFQAAAAAVFSELTINEK